MNPKPELDKPAPPPWAKNRFEGIKNIATIVALIAGIGWFAWYVLTSAFTSSDVASVNRVLGEAVSPDGKWRAVQYVHGGQPATFTGVGIQDSKLGVDPTKSFNYVLAIQWRQDFKMKWDDAKHLTITILKDAKGCQVMTQKDKFEDITIKYIQE